MNVYDFDKTIYRSDSTADFYLFCVRRHPKAMRFLPTLLCGYLRFYLLKKGSKTEFKQRMFLFLRYVDTDKDVGDFWTTHERKIKQQYLDRQQHDDVIISASPRFLLQPICKKLGIKHLICSEVDPKTGRYTGLNCQGKEKVPRFNDAFGDAVIDEFYSDSYSDTPMAERAKTAYLVKGNRLFPWKHTDNRK